MSIHHKGILFTSMDNKQELIVTAKGPSAATIVIPTDKPMELVPVSEIQHYVAKEIFNNDTPPPPLIHLPPSSTIKAGVDITVELKGAINHPDTTYVYEVATDGSFRTIIATVTKVPFKDPGGYNKLTTEDLRLMGLSGVTLDKDDNVITKARYYFLRVKVFINNIVTDYSIPVKFKLDVNTYDKPIVSSFSLIDDPRNIENEAKTHKLKTKYFTFEISKYKVIAGSLPVPKYIKVYLSSPGKNTKTTIYNIPYDPEKTKYLFAPKWGITDTSSTGELLIKPLNTYNIKIQFEGELEDGSIVKSDLSDPSPNVTIPISTFYRGKLVIQQHSGKVPSIPTLGMEGFYVDYEILDIIMENLGSNFDPKDPDGIVYDFNIINKLKKEVYKTSIKRPLNELVSEYGTETFFTLQRRVINAGQTYTMNCVMRLEGKNAATIRNLLKVPENETFTLAFKVNSSVNQIPTDKLEKVVKSYPNRSSSLKWNGWFGEVFSEGDNSFIAEDTNYRGTLRTGVEYKTFDEVTWKDKLWMVTKERLIVNDLETFDPKPEELIEVTLENHKILYNSGLPSYTWLARAIGLPLDRLISINSEGKMIPKAPCSSIMNRKAGWIKVSNFAKQILYIAKRPIAINIPYRELKRRFLTGDMTRTIRIGLNYYSVRLLEVGPNEVLGETYLTKNTTKPNTNFQNEIDLYKALFDNLQKYSLPDIGLNNDLKCKTFSAKGILTNTTSLNERNEIVIHTDVEELIDYDEQSELHYYRPVLELIRYDKLPITLSKPLPGPTNLEYDRFSDTGYYGKLTSDSFLSSTEIKTIFNLPFVHSFKDNLIFHKFYYHGLTVIIPTSPLGMIAEQDVNKLFNNDCVFGTDSNETVIIKGNKWKMMLPNLSTSMYLDGNKVVNNRKIDPDSIIGGLINRVSNIFKSNNTINNNLVELSKFKNVVGDGELDNKLLEGFFLKDLTLSNNVLDPDNYEQILLKDQYSLARFRDNKIWNNVEDSHKADYKKSLWLWPVFITETIDRTKDVSYKNVTPLIPNIVYKKKKYVEYEIVPKHITRERQVKKTRIEEYYETITVERKIPTGRSKYNEVEIYKPEYGYGLMFTYCKKTDEAYLTKELYDRTMLNIKPFKTGLKVNFSRNYKDIGDYLVRSTLINSERIGNRDPILINKKFYDIRDLRSYLKTLVVNDIEIGSLTNEIYNRIQTNTKTNLPLGLFYGKISSRSMAYAIPRWYKVDEKDEVKIKKDPMILNVSGVYSNTWVDVYEDEESKVEIPMLNNYLDYDSFSTLAKSEILEPIVKYITNYVYRDRIKVDNLEEFMETVKKEYAFGIVGCEISTLMLLEGGGINEGNPSDPKIITADGELPYYMEKYPKAIDIFNPEDMTKSEFIEKQVKREREVVYYEMETYVETIFEERRMEKEKLVPVVEYKE